MLYYNRDPTRDHNFDNHPYASVWNQNKVVQQVQVLSSARYLSWCSPGVIRHVELAGHNLIVLLVVGPCKIVFS